MHVFLIPDGNRRFAKVKHISRADAHMQGAERIKDVIKWCRESKDVTQLSVYVLSSDNINKRNDDEVKMLCALCIKELLKLSRLKSDVDGVVVNIVCTYDGYTRVSQLKKQIKLTKQRFERHNRLISEDKNKKDKQKLILNLLIGYSAEEDIRDTTWYMRDTLSYADFIKNFRSMLSVKDDVDLVIRTGGQKRLSGGLVLQSMYAEIFFSDTLLPAFTKSEFNKIISWYKKCSRRYGK